MKVVALIVLISATVGLASPAAVCGPGVGGFIAMKCTNDLRLEDECEARYKSSPTCRGRQRAGSMHRVPVRWLDWKVYLRMCSKCKAEAQHGR
jgi:hypothetical protein